MDINVVVQLISNVGFPIAMCILMYIRMSKESEQHKAEIEKLSEAISNNTIVLEQLKTILDRRGQQ